MDKELNLSLMNTDREKSSKEFGEFYNSFAVNLIPRLSRLRGHSEEKSFQILKCQL